MLPSWSVVQQARLAELMKDSSVTIAYWNSNVDGFPINHIESWKDSIWQASPGKVQEVIGPLELCSPHALHATEQPHRWRGVRVWMVALFGETQRERDKLGALKREILGEILPNEAFLSPSVACRLGCKNLSRAELSKANLSGANLSKADLSKANLSGAILSGANLSGVKLYEAYRPYDPPKGWKVNKEGYLEEE